MAMIFRYEHVPRPDGTLKQAPFIPFVVTNKFGRQMKVTGLVDSGADTTVIPKDLAEILGLKEKREDFQTGGIGGYVNVKESRISLKMVGQRETYNFDVPALVLQDPNSDIPLIIGRNGFFEEFEITFKQDEQKLVLKKINPKKKYL